MKINTNFAIFILFFGLALVEALERQNILEAVLFFVLGAVFFQADKRS